MRDMCRLDGGAGQLFKVLGKHKAAIEAPLVSGEIAIGVVSVATAADAVDGPLRFPSPSHRR